jgi:hypothetical protein
MRNRYCSLVVTEKSFGCVLDLQATRWRSLLDAKAARERTERL